jgi:hypothetical protein
MPSTEGDRGPEFSNPRSMPARLVRQSARHRSSNQHLLVRYKAIGLRFGNRADDGTEQLLCARSSTARAATPST